MPTIPLDTRASIQLAISRPDGQTWTDVTDYLQEAEVNLGDVTGIGTGQSGGDSVVRNLDFTLRNDENTFNPRDKISDWNEFNGEYAPLLWPTREVVLRIAIQEEDAYNQELGTTQRIKEPLGTGSGTYNVDYYPLLVDSEKVYVDDVETENYTINYDTGEVSTTETGSISISYTYYYPLFAGYLGDSISSDGYTVSCSCRDYAKRMMDTYIEEANEYGT